MVAKTIPVEGVPPFISALDRGAERAFEPGWLARLLARVRSVWLDRALIEGADPHASRQLAARSSALASPRFRRSIADGLERVLEAAHEPARTRWRLPQRGGHLFENAVELRELSAELRLPAPVYARGIALANELLLDGTGPLYWGDRHALASRLCEVRAAFAGDEGPGGDRPMRRGLKARQGHPSARRLGPSSRLAGGSWIYRRGDSS